MAANTNPLTFNSYLSQIGVLAVLATETVAGVVQGVDDYFNTLTSSMLNYAELRIQRDLDILPSLETNTYTLAAGVNVLPISVDDFVTIQTININLSGALTTLIPASKEFIFNVYGSTDTASQAQPQYFAMVGGDSATFGNTFNNIMFGPCPDSAYPISVAGTVRLPSLYQNANTGSAATATTFISTYYPDLLIQASMIYVSQFQRNFGPSVGTNDSEMPGAYEAQYQNLLKTAVVEEGRKKFAASAWSAMAPAFIATPSR